MAEIQMHEYAKSKGFHSRVLERWLGWEQPARDALFRLATSLKLGENHLRDLMDWLEEISLRDRSTIEAILSSKTLAEIESNPRLGRADKVKRVKEEIRRMRFPRLAQTEESIRTRIQALKLHPAIRLTAPPGLEGGRLRVELSASAPEELKRLADQLGAGSEQQKLCGRFLLCWQERSWRFPQSQVRF